MKGRVLVVENIASWRKRLMDTLHAEGFEVHAATTLEEARQRLYQVKPDVLVLDMKLRAYGYQGWTILDELEVMPNSPEVIVCTGEINDPRQLREMRRGFGVFDIILKEIYQKDHFIQMVWDAMEAKRSADDDDNGPEPRDEPSISPDTSVPCPLTEAEKAVMREVARGKPTKEISANRGVKPNTTKAQLRSIFDKLGATNRIEAIRKARKLGCIPGDDDDLI